MKKIKKQLSEFSFVSTLFLVKFHPNLKEKDKYTKGIIAGIELIERSFAIEILRYFRELKKNLDNIPKKNIEFYEALYNILKDYLFSKKLYFETLRYYLYKEPLLSEYVRDLYKERTI